MTQIDGPAAAAVDEPADADLVLRTRSGDRAAFGELWRRHYRSGVTVARSVTSSLDPDDLVQEAYARIYQSILKGGGPTGSFRAYLFTSIRNTAAAWGRARRETAIDELETFEDPASSEEATADALDRSITVQAFRSLPTRWQEVLWYTEIEGMKPAEVAPLLGMKATAVAQLAFRAREGLREAWIQAHLRSVEDGSDCQWTIERLGAYARNNLGIRDTAKLERHLADCARCAIVAAEAKDVGRRLALVLLPLTVGITGAAAYLAALQSGAAPVLAVAAMPSSVVEGAVIAGAAGAGGAGTGGASGTGAAGGAGGGAFSSIGAIAGIAAAGIVVAGAVVAAALVPGLLGGTPMAPAEAGIVAPADTGTKPDAPVTAPEATTPVVAPPPVVPPAEPVVPPPADDPVAKADDPAPTTPTTPAAPVSSAQPSAPTDPTAPTDPAPPTDPTDPTDPAPPLNPDDPADPDPPADPADPADPAPASALPDGSPAVAGADWSFVGIQLNIAISVQGEPGATVQALVGGDVEDTATVGDDGTAVLTLRPTLAELLANATVGIRYVAGDATGPTTDVTLGRLLVGAGADRA